LIQPSLLFAKSFPKASQVYKDAFAQYGDKLLIEAGIDTPLRISHFLAQCGHECAGYTVVRENMSYSAGRLLAVFGVGKHSAAITKSEAEKLAKSGPALAERVYGLGNPKKAKDLGNIRQGDGWRYRGNGPLQNTGRKQHALAGFEANPEDLAKPENILKPAIKFWLDNKLNGLADKNDINGLTKRINGGYNGIADRVALFDKIFKVASGGASSWKVADVDKGVEFLQRDLIALGYAIKADGRLGPATAKAVSGFQKSAGLKVDGIAGAVTKAKIKAVLEAGSARTDERPSPTSRVTQVFGVVSAAAGTLGQPALTAADKLSSFGGVSPWVTYACFGLTVVGGVCLAIPQIRAALKTPVVPA